MELQGDMCHVESYFGLIGVVLVSVQDRCTVCAKHTIGLEIILTHSMILQGDEAQVEACFGPF